MRHVLQTGQIRCYNGTGRELPCTGSGQDGEFYRGEPWPFVRYMVQGEVVVDHLTGLTWTRDSNIGGFPCTWSEAFEQIAVLNQQQYGGYADWRLPNRNELRSLVCYQAKNPALPGGHPFTNFFLGWYWSSTTAAINPAYAWSIHLEGARMFYGRKDQAYLFWPVRGIGNSLLPTTGQKQCFDIQGKEIACSGTGQDGDFKFGTQWPCPRFSIQSEIVHDRLTDLYWTRHADLTGRPVNWERALDAVSEWSLTIASLGLIWGLPNINELASLVDCSTHSPALPESHPFIGVKPGYWASTTSYFETDWAWVLYLDKGACGVGYKAENIFYVWPVGISRVSNSPI